MKKVLIVGIIVLIVVSALFYYFNVMKKNDKSSQVNSVETPPILPPQNPNVNTQDEPLLEGVNPGKGIFDAFLVQMKNDEGERQRAFIYVAPDFGNINEKYQTFLPQNNIYPLSPKDLDVLTRAENLKQKSDLFDTLSDIVSISKDFRKFKLFPEAKDDANVFIDKYICGVYTSCKNNDKKRNEQAQKQIGNVVIEINKFSEQLLEYNNAYENYFKNEAKKRLISAGYNFV